MVRWSRCVCVSVLLLVVSGEAGSVCDPWFRGALWWITPRYYEWTREDFAAGLEKQREVGCDLLWLLNTPALLARSQEGHGDVLKTLLDLAGERDMQVIVDLPQGGWYGKTDVETMVAEVASYARDFRERYASHPSFHGWYLNHEINPIAPEDATQTLFWRAAWKGMVEVCEREWPGTIVTISPFFLLDKERKRGFVYQAPEEYAGWWGATIKETGIDVLMLQDSGEHLEFFTLADREPFWRATAEAVREAGGQFWLNVESAEVPVASWEEYLKAEAEKAVRYEALPPSKLTAKLERASKFADSLVNWGYFPFMNPNEPEASKVPGAGEAFEAYRKVVGRMRKSHP